MYKRKLPTNSKTVSINGGYISPRDITVMSSCVNTCSSLISFGDEHYNKHKSSGNTLAKYEGKNKGRGYICYKENEETVSIVDIYVECINTKEEIIAIEALIECVFNTCKAIDKDLIVEINNPKIERYIDFTNQKYKEQKIEDIYWWKKE